MNCDAKCDNKTKKCLRIDSNISEAEWEKIMYKRQDQEMKTKKTETSIHHILYLFRALILLAH